MDDPSRILAQARQQLEALKQAGLSRADLLALLEDEPTQQLQPQPQQLLLQQTSQPQPHITPDASGLQNFSYQEMNASFKPPPQYRSSVSTISSSSSHDSVFSATSATSARSSVSTSSNPVSESKFWCTSCNKTFKRKFDWKRHEEEFHDRSRKYPCDSCNQSFWGPNTFNQHHKSAHGCQTCPHAEMVMRPMKKRRAYGCGFCAALHGQFERHIDHVATHFENGATKQEWSHSNVIYGLLHQHGIIEAWKALIASKQSQFNGRQPLFGWSPDSTGRAHGFIENENPGQLQDLLEFFDGSKESAKRIIQLAETCVHVFLRPKSPDSAVGIEPVPPATTSTASSGSHRPSASRHSVREPRRSSSSSAVVRSSKASRRAVSGTGTGPNSNAIAYEAQPANASLTPVPSMALPSSSPQPQSHPHSHLPLTSNVYPGYMPVPDSTASHQPSLTPMSTNPATYTDKALPPPPLDPVSPMAVDFPPFPETHHIGAAPPQVQVQGFLPEVDFVSDWQSFTSTLVGGMGEDHSQQHQQAMPNFAQQGFPMSWEDLGQYPGTPGPQV
ncbi:hypothetical protein GGS20DRAFT_581397 [Poronia punctata]|nr:hypothetical protein GGS20DRAFT_581397 [Poronia punctata]